MSAPTRSGVRAPLLSLLLAALIAVASALGPAAAPGTPLSAILPVPAAHAAANGLDLQAATRYVIDTAKRSVHVTVDLVAVNRQPDATSGGVVTSYYFAGVNLGAQTEGTGYRATEGGTALQVTTAPRSGYRLVTVRFAKRLYYGDTARVRLTFTLPAGAPRSSSDIRVGTAFATFLAWAFGDRGTIRIDVPAGFTVDTNGGSMVTTTGNAGAHILTASTTDAGAWYAWINARNDAGLTAQRLQLGDGEQIVVRAWPEDRSWRQRVASVLSRGVPVLAGRIGLPWPVDGPLSVLEIHAPLLEGYAGFYNAGKQEITISEDLDDLTIVHEVSHAWFNANLFTERWITEGLADEYAFRTLAALGIKVSGPPAVAPGDAAAFPLDSWPPPAPIRTRTADAREQWGYDASWTIVRRIVKLVGEPGMRAVFAAAAAGTTAYVGAVPAERTALPNDWRRFLDLTEELGGVTGVADIIGPWALTPGDRAALAARAPARTAWRALVVKDAGWAAPVVVRLAMDGWQFPAAMTAMTEATTVISQRDAIEAVATAQHLAVPVSLERAYEAAATQDALVQAGDQAGRLRSSLDAVATAATAAATPRDWLVSLGLAGQDPDSQLAAARTAWEAGDTATAASDAAAVASALAVAADGGRLRAVAVGLGLAAVVLLLVVAVGITRRHRRRHVAPAPAAIAGRPASLSADLGPDGRTLSGTTVLPGSPPGAPDATMPPPPPAWPAGPPVSRGAEPALASWSVAEPSPSAGKPADATEPYATLPPSTTAGDQPERPATVADEGADPS